MGRMARARTRRAGSPEILVMAMRLLGGNGVAPGPTFGHSPTPLPASFGAGRWPSIQPPDWANSPNQATEVHQKVGRTSRGAELDRVAGGADERQVCVAEAGDVADELRAALVADRHGQRPVAELGVGERED